ncbi:MAG: PIG-L family deacetylase [Bacteroidota bacterium]
MRYIPLLLGLCLSFLYPIKNLRAQDPIPPKSASEIQHALKKIQVLGSVLYIAAHPDDENTRMIAYYAKGKGYRTAYLSLTRGDGGQNLLGNEKGFALGILRTQELLQARRTDGGEQMFSRAYDFGYSKTPEETLKFWDKEKVLADVVWAIRKFRPDIIVTRFPGMDKGGGGHGHHTSSHYLAEEAFTLAADPKAFPEQLEFVDTWQTKRLFWNTYSWRGEPSKEKRAQYIGLDAGAYDPLLGKSYGEIAAEARSMHKCQAFGTLKWRGSLNQYLDQEMGDKATSDEMEGVDVSWDRVKGSKKVKEALAKAYSEFSAAAPDKIIPHLLVAYKEMQKLDDPWVEVKMKELKALLIYCSGLWFEIGAKKPFAAQGTEADFAISVLKRGSFPIHWKSVNFPQWPLEVEVDKKLYENARPGIINQTLSLEKLPVSQPYWLVNKPAAGVFQVKNQELIGLPENPAAIKGEFVFDFDGVEIPFEIPAIHRYADPGIGELFRPFVVSPKVTINIPEKVYLFANQKEKKIKLLVKSLAGGQEVEIAPKADEGWSFSPPLSTLSFEKEGEEQIVEIIVKPPANQSVSTLKIEAKVGDEISSYGLQTIAYTHIPTQMLFPAAEAKLVQVNIEKRGERIAYIMGSGDEVPVSLEQIGYQVDILEDDKISVENLRQYDAVIAGIRVYNTNKRMPFLEERIMEYVKEGGTYLVQYNTTSRGGNTPAPGPYKLKISRDRVSQEDAAVKILKPEHPVLNQPNKITQVDFDAWIQERGLYFPNEWGDEYEALLEMNDTGESPKQGSLLVAKYGEGHIIYSGLSWFRELPAGVPGAYRLIANLISIGKESR